MTTAHRPTFNSARGGPDQGGNKILGGTKQFSSRDLPGHLKLKTRQSGQNTKDEVVKRDLKAELEDKESKHKRDREKEERKRGERIQQIEAERDKAAPPKLLTQGSAPGKSDLNIDADDEDDDPGDKSSEDDDDDEDDTAELMRELERIKRERAEEQMRKEAQRREQEKREREEAVLRGNPLVDVPGTSSFTVTRRWDDDVVFKNQTVGEPVKKKRFINDTVRNDFHRRFLEKYVQ